MLGQIEFNGIKTYDDFKFIISDIAIADPTPNNILISVPYANGVYDFSSIFGDITYSTREISVTFKLEKFEIFQYRLNALYNIFKDKFYTNSMEELKISWLEGIFLAKTIEISSLNLMEEERMITVKFIAQPFRTLEKYEGDDIWDTFCFETDYVQYNKHEIDGTKEIILYNLSIVKSIPKIVCTAPMTLIYNEKEYSLISGENNNIIKMNKGENKLIFKGNGTVEILWKREVI